MQVRLLTAWIVAASGLSAAEPVAVYVQRGATISVADNGIWEVRSGRTLQLTGGRLALWGPGWRGTDQRAASDLQVTRQGAARVISGTLVEPVSGGRLLWRQTVGEVTDGLRIAYEIHPQAAVMIQELSWMADLPADLWKGQGLQLFRGVETRFPLQPPTAKHFVTATATRYVFGSGQPTQLSLGLDHPRTCNVQDLRVEQGTLFQPFVKILEGGEVQAGDVLRLELLVRANDPTVYRSATYRVGSAQPLRLGAVQSAPARPQAGQLLRLRVALQGTWTSPFRSQDIALDAEIQSAGRTWRVPGCFTLDHRSQETGGREALEPVGEAGWEVRFLPPDAGDYTVRLQARDRSGEVTSDYRFTASPGPARPYLRVAQHDPHYFEFTDGRPYFANGLNICWARRGYGTLDYQRWFAKLGEQGGNYARLWMPSWDTGFEWGRPGEYQLDHAWVMDRVLELAQQHGIHLKVCLENFRTFDADNPYSQANGGPCATVLEVFTNPTAQQMWRDRLRYAVARWGWSPNVMAWEFWNEIDCVQGYQAPVVQRWAREMSRYLRELDPYDHLIVNSLGSFVSEPELWSSPEFDFAQMHGYWHPTWRSKEFGKDLAATMATEVPRIRQFGKPCFFAEFGLVNETWGHSPRSDDDPTGVNLHTGMWGAMMAGAAGPAHLWWWDTYVDPRNLWHHFGALGRFTADIPWNTAGFEPAQATAGPGLVAPILRSPNLTLVWLRNQSWTWWNVAERAPLPAVANATCLLPLPPGTYLVERWDPWTGQRLATTTSTADATGLRLSAGDLATATAWKVRPRG
ncbi:MAG: cellulase family glycosylhydrolase [Fimbriimonadaceae bacterium]|nr:cellulase family glycosylhydrolase [Fimbriimonadaceae bacterium]